MNTNNNKYHEYQDVFENINVQNWFKNLALNEPLAFTALIGDNRKNFKKIFDGIAPSESNDNCVSWKILDQGVYFFITIQKENNESQLADDEYIDNFSTYYMVKYFGDNEKFKTDINMSSCLIQFLGKILKNLANANNS